MSIRFRKSIKIAPGIKLNLGKKSASVTVGGKLLRETVSTSEKTTHSVSIPGTGIYATKTTTRPAAQTAEYDEPTSILETLRVEPDERIVPEAMNWLRTQAVCKEASMASALNIPYSQASRIVNDWESQGVVGPFRGAQGREIL